MTTPTPEQIRTVAAAHHKAIRDARQLLTGVPEPSHATGAYDYLSGPALVTLPVRAALPTPECGWMTNFAAIWARLRPGSPSQNNSSPGFLRSLAVRVEWQLYEPGHGRVHRRGIPDQSG